MKQLESLIQHLEARYHINIEQFLKMYSANKTTEEIKQHFNTSQWAVRAVASALNLRMSKQFRTHDLSMFYTRYGDKASDKLIQEIDSLQSALDQLSHDLLIKDKALLRERARLRGYRKLERELVKGEDIANLIEQIAEAHVSPVELYVKPVIASAPSQKDTVQFAVLSDLHAESLVTKEEVGEVNEYSWETMVQRLRSVFAHLTNSHSELDVGLHIYLLGDLISGIIHDALEATSKHPVEAIALLSELMAFEIAKLIPQYQFIQIFAVSGNHERLTQQMKSENKGFDFGYLLYKLIEAKLKPFDSVNLQTSTTGLIVAPLPNNKYAGLHHGDHFRGSTGDLNRALRIKEAFRQQGTDVDHLIQGHTHCPQVTALPTKGVEIVNGSLIGTNQYSHTNGFIGIPWGQFIGRWGIKGNAVDLTLVNSV